jgi:hypothetical protein
MSPIEKIFQAYEEGHPAVLLTGRSLYDLITEADNKIRPLLDAGYLFHGWRPLLAHRRCS